MVNDEIARLLREIAIYLEMDDVPFRPRAYEKASEGVLGSDEDMKEVYARGGLKALEQVPAVGVSIAEKIEEFLKTGRIAYHDELKKKVPVELGEFAGIEGIGPKTLKTLYQKLKVRNLADLEKAAQQGKIKKLPGFGPKSEENILQGIAFVRRSGGRFVLGQVMPEIELIRERLGVLAGVESVTVAGSVRRRKDTVGDADLLVIAKKPKPVMDYFVAMPEVVQVHAHGETKSSVKLKNGMDVDVRIVPKESYGAALNYFTGSKDHNVALRELAIKKGWKLNEYGLFAGTKRIAGKTEDEVYRKLGLRYIEPELREMTGELEAARKNALPDLIPYGSLRGDLQVQTDWTDGDASIEEMAQTAIKAGLDYIVITDHTKRLAMTHGLDAKRIKQQWAEIDRVNAALKKKGKKFTILKGTECDILKDGTMDLPDEILAQCDVVGGSVHSLFNLPEKEQTARIMRAMSNPHVDIIFHPTGRVLNKREAYAVNMPELIRHAKKTGTVLEIDAYPDRADLKAEHIRLCVEAGVKMSIDSDAHAPAHIQFLDYGVAQARRGWAGKKDIINAWPLEKMLKMLK
ncbi:DNA polymerase/3'-5' exonuclease PolX [Patescibacteria group bacterium]|nr:DNA polymerase/3'-5' exonuclease PolX [Patescibacteria group bacterium]